MQARVFVFRPSIAVAASFILMIGMFVALQAQAASLSDNQAKLERLYGELLADPANVDKTLEYSELAVEVGDYEAAIPPLERLLITNPGANKIKLELGIMYYLLGSYDVARTYFTEITQDSSASPNYQRQAQSYLNRL